ncbi:MAG: SDR family oxidoreductase [Proteobacteria bacterium]|nr:SDR family oxidoreductase [Pseudomonadota bacterium]
MQEKPVAVISGGSSGIGLEIARQLAARGYRLLLVARDESRLAAAATSIGAPSCVMTCALDVADEAACAQVIARAVRELGRLDWLITSAGIAEPGAFTELDSAAHRRQMEINYFGSLNLVRPAAAFMADRGGGRITLVSSAAAFVGIAGYSAYAPGKFAVRGLGEALRAELLGAGITVSVAFPPDTNTPQYAQEQATKPDFTKRITAGGGVLNAQTVARSIIAGAEAGRFMLTPGWLMSLYGWAHSLYAPFFLRKQSRIVVQCMREKKTAEQ